MLALVLFTLEPSLNIHWYETALVDVLINEYLFTQVLDKLLIVKLAVGLVPTEFTLTVVVNESLQPSIV